MRSAMKTSLPSIRCWCLGVLLALGAGCSKTTTDSPVAAPTASSAAAAPASLSSALPESPELPRIDSVDQRLLCATPALESSGAAPLEELRQDLQSLEQDLEAKRAAAAAAVAPTCKAEVRSYVEIFAQLDSSSQTLCDRQAAAGVGVNGATLARETAALVADIHAQHADIEGAKDADCVARRDRLAVRVTEWREQRDRLCAATSGQTAVIACGVSGSDAVS